MIAGILQSSYLPWLGVFDLFDRADVFVFHDDLQYDRSWRNRNRIRVPGGEGWRWLTVPVKLADGSQTLLNQTGIDNGQGWARKHWALIYQAYHQAPFFADYAAPYQEIYLRKKWERLVDLNLALTLVILGQLGLKTKIINSVDLHLGDIKKNERLVKLCRQIGADTWLANSACRDYVIPEIYQKAGIEVVYQDYEHPVYQQLHEPFVSHLSVIDLIFNHGPKSLVIIRSTRWPGKKKGKARK